jgi:hypothetical protein
LRVDRFGSIGEFLGNRNNGDNQRRTDGQNSRTPNFHGVGNGSSVAAGLPHFFYRGADQSQSIGLQLKKQTTLT